MKKVIPLMIAVYLLLLPLEVTVYSQQGTNDSPPVSQALVREGDFAFELVESLKLGVSRDEAQAESTLAYLGIVPRNGWIADYPMTPDIIVEVLDTTGAAAGSGKLSLSRSDAEEAVRTVTAKLGLPVTAAGDDQTQYASTEDYSYYYDTTAIDNYYEDQGPPVITYYTPPWDYYYLYSWVPFPFWCGGFFFGGFFVQHDFDRVVRVHTHFNRNNVFVNRTMDKRATNHLPGTAPGQVARVDPVARSTGSPWRITSNIPPMRGFNTSEARSGAQSILTHSTERVPSGGTGNLMLDRGSNVGGSIMSNSAAQSTGQVGASRNTDPSPFNGRSGNQLRSSAPERSMGMSANEAVTRSARPDFSSMSRSNGFENRGGISRGNDPGPSFHNSGGAFSSSHWGWGGFSGAFHNGGGSARGFHSGGNAFAGIHNGGGLSGGFHGGGGSFGGFHGGGLGHGGGGHGGR
jgi:hypothetical protein